MTHHDYSLPQMEIDPLQLIQLYKIEAEDH